MDPRWEPHNLHRVEGPEVFAVQDPTLRALRRQPLVHESALLGTLPYATPGIYTLRGGRQVGKTTFVKQSMLRLMQGEGVLPDQIIYLTGDALTDGDDLRRAIAEYTAPPEAGDFAFVFVDEITAVPEWDRAVKFLADAGVLERTFLLLTGSDLVLIRDALKRLPGRRGRAPQVDFHLHPLSFLEFCRIRAEVGAGCIDAWIDAPLRGDLPELPGSEMGKLFEEFRLYHVTGGFLTAINDHAREGRIAEATLRIYSDWIRGDILRKNRSEATLREVLTAITTRYGSQVTWNALSRDLCIDHPKTVADYCSLLERMDAAFVVPALREDRLDAAPKKARKLYFSDPFIHHAVRFWLRSKRPSPPRPEDTRDDPAFLAAEAEATLLGHLRRSLPTYYIKGQQEVDAVYVKGDRFWPIEVKWTRTLRPNELKQVLKYPNALIAAQVREQHEISGVPVLPAPVVLLRASRLSESGARHAS